MIITSDSPPVTIPRISVTEYVLRQAERLAAKPAIIDGPGDRTLSYGALADAIRRAATGLARRGFRKGDVFAIYSPNVPEYAIAFYAVASLGGINTTANPLYTAGALAVRGEQGQDWCVLYVGGRGHDGCVPGRRDGTRKPPRMAVTSSEGRCPAYALLGSRRSPHASVGGSCRPPPLRYRTLGRELTMSCSLHNQGPRSHESDSMRAGQSSAGGEAV